MSSRTPTTVPRAPRGAAVGVIAAVVAALLMLSVAAVPALASPSDPPFRWEPMSTRTYDGHRIGPCAGDAPIACVRRDGRLVGSVEHFSAPKSSFDILDGVRSPERAIRLVARDFIRSFRADRTTSCPDLRFRAIRPTGTTVAGGPGSVWGFELLDGDRVVERVLDHGTVRRGQIHILVAEGADAGSCLPREGGFTVRGLERFARAYTSLAHDSRFEW